MKDDCQSWYRKDGQGKSGDVVTGLWPGSTLHCIEALRSPRWEDYLYEYPREENGAEENQMAWLGNGWALTQTYDEPRMIDLVCCGPPSLRLIGFLTETGNRHSTLHRCSKSEK